MGVLGALLLVLLSLVPDEQAELVADFRRFYAKARTPRERLEAVLVLKDIDTLDAAQALLAAFEDEDPSVRQAAVDVVGGYRTVATAQWLMDAVLLDKKLARNPALRALAAEALGRMGQSFAYWPLLNLLDERDPGLRLAGIAALGSLKDPQACPRLSELAASSDATVAVAALDALVRIGSAPDAEAAVIAAFRHADWQVRARAIAAVLELRLKSGIRPLIERLGDEDGRLAGDAYQALKALTLRDFSDQPADWVAWWDRTEPVFQMPDIDKVAAARAAQLESGTRYTAGQKQFLRVETRSENILFVIDVSGSMEVPFGDPERLKSLGRTYKSLQRLEIVKEELIHTVQELPDTTSFNIMAFASGIKSWKKEAVKANLLNKSNAEQWIERLRPLGGEQASFKARTGLETAINEAAEGSTNTHLALMTALGERVEEKGIAGAISSAASPVDTVFFLTDGEPTVGKSVDMHEIRREVLRINALRRIQIHVIYVGEFGGDDFEKLAHENNGVFVAIGG